MGASPYGGTGWGYDAGRGDRLAAGVVRLHPSAGRRHCRFVGWSEWMVLWRSCYRHREPPQGTRAHGNRVGCTVVTSGFAMGRGCVHITGKTVAAQGHSHHRHHPLHHRIMAWVDAHSLTSPTWPAQPHPSCPRLALLHQSALIQMVLGMTVALSGGDGRRARRSDGGSGGVGPLTGLFRCDIKLVTCSLAAADVVTHW